MIEQRADSSAEFRKRERLGEIVVGAALERPYAVLDRPTCRDHHDRSPRSSAANIFEYLDPIPPRQVEIEYHEVIVSSPGQGTSLNTVAGNIDSVTLLLQRSPKERGQPSIVFGH
jgi:hypothetical protein